MIKNNIKKIALTLVFIILLILFLVFDLYNYIGLDKINGIKEWILSFGIFGPIIYILLYWISCLFFLPGLPITIVGAIVFGPVLGTILISIGSTTGATLSFLFARYIGRDFIVKKLGSNPTYEKIDQGVKKQGARMLIITRLVPIFPFNLQNYLYGLTDINILTYMFFSWLCMLPGTIAYAFLAGAIVSGEGDTGKTFLYLGIGAIFLVGVSYLPKLFNKDVA